MTRLVRAQSRSGVRLASLLALLLLTGCTASTERPAPPPPVANAPAVCPEKPGGGTCSGQRRCDYEGVKCECIRKNVCSGVPPRPDEPRPVIYGWRCEWDEGVMRADGCPGRVPKVGDPCTRDTDAYCFYGDCCVERIRCVDGKWADQRGPDCPP